MSRLESFAWVAACAATIAASLAGDDVRIQDPYAQGQGRWWRGQVHAHSTTHRYFVHPDSLRDKVERYRDAGYDFVCMTDHNQVTTVPEAPVFPLPTRDPGVSGIHFISGAEIGFILPQENGGLGRKHHFGAVGMDWSVSKGESLFALSETDVSTAQAAIDSIGTRRYAEGKPTLAILNHPEMEAMTDVRIYPGDLRRIRGQAGIEVFNTKWGRSNPRSKTWQSHGASHWDFLLAHGSGTRWGFATDDAHEYVFGEDFLGGWIEVRAPARTTQALLDAIRAGCFVACVDSCSGAARDTASARFTELGARERRIVAASDRSSEFTWWTDFGHLVRTRGNVGADTFHVEGWERSVRVRLRNDRGAAYSQPFFVESPDRDPDRWRLRKEERTELLVHFDEGSGAVAHDESGRGRDVAIRRGFTPAVSEWRTFADTSAWRDSLWGGWMLNGVGTTPDETDVDRDRSGYALRSHGQDFYGEIEKGAAFAPDGAFTIELVGVIRARSGRPQPILVNESRGSDERRCGWRLAAADSANRAGDYVFTGATKKGARSLAFGRGLAGEAHLIAIVVEPDRDGCRVRAYAGGALAADASWPPLEAGGAVAASSFFLLRDPFADPSASPTVFFALRELRLTSAARSADAIRSDAERLELTNPTAPTAER